MWGVREETMQTLKDAMLTLLCALAGAVVFAALWAGALWLTLALRSLAGVTL